MCPSITKTCCQNIDQEVMFSNWVHDKEEETVNNRYNNNAKVYQELITHLIQVQDFAKAMRKSIAKRVSNCKLISERIMNFEVRGIESQITKNLEKMREFFKETYKGFYCSVCNYENQKFFDLNTKTVVFSEKFCRDIVENALGPLLVLHVDIIKYLNLVTKFVTSCDSQGEYNLEAEFPKSFTFFEITENREMLESCRTNRNAKDWFSYCKDVCMNFQIYSFSSFFEPNVNEIRTYNEFLKNQLTLLNNHQLAQALLNPPSTPPAKTRILSETTPPAVPAAKSTIYKRGLGPKVDLGTWKVDFRVSGISLYDEGRNSLITSSMYNSVRTLLQLSRENSNVNKASTLSAQDQKILSGVSSRSLNSPQDRSLSKSTWISNTMYTLIGFLLWQLS